MLSYFTFTDRANSFATISSVVAITDDSGKTLEEYRYDAFGKAYLRDGKSDNYREFKVSKISNSRLFTGREFDRETGLYYYRARTYDAGLGRFLQRDPIGTMDQINLYTYVASNPVKYVDPMGTDKKIIKTPIDSFFYSQILDVLSQPFYDKLNPYDFIADAANAYNFKLNPLFKGNDYSKQLFTVEGKELRGDEMGNFFIGFNGAEHGLSLSAITTMSYGGQYIAEVSDKGAGYLGGFYSAAVNEREDNIWYIVGYLYNKQLRSSWGRASDAIYEEKNREYLKNALEYARIYTTSLNHAQ